MKQLLRIVLGFLPLGVGFLQNAYMMARMDTLPPLMLIALGTLLLWGLLSYLTFDGKSRVLSQTLAFNAASLLALALVLVQELLLGHYWPNWAGVASHQSDRHSPPALPLARRRGHQSRPVFHQPSHLPQEAKGHTGKRRASVDFTDALFTHCPWLWVYVGIAPYEGAFFTAAAPCAPRAPASVRSGYGW